LICEIPKVAVTTWSSREVKLAGPTYRKYLEKARESLSRREVSAIIGQPGMGKTTILRRLALELGDSAIFLDLAGKNGFEEEFWAKVEAEKVRSIVFPRLERGRYGYGFLKRLMGVSFREHMERNCHKFQDVRARLFCMNYSKDFDGMLKFLSDAREELGISLLVDEVRENHVPQIHRLINSGVGVPVVMAIPTEVYSRVTDLAIRRRLDESRITLDSALTEEDIREIVETYCSPLREELFPVVLELWNGRELNTVSSILQFIRSEVERAEANCNGDLSCVKEEFLKSHTLKDPEEDSRKLEKLVRDELNAMSHDLGISYVHPRGKRVEVDGKYAVVGLFFLRDDVAHVGLVKLKIDGSGEDQDLEVLSKVEKVEHEKREYPVGGRLLVTNSPSLDSPRVTKLLLSTMEVTRILQGDLDLLRERMRSMLELRKSEGREQAIA